MFKRFIACSDDSDRRSRADGRGADRGAWRSGAGEDSPSEEKSILEDELALRTMLKSFPAVEADASGAEEPLVGVLKWLFGRVFLLPKYWTNRDTTCALSFLLFLLVVHLVSACRLLLSLANFLPFSIWLARKPQRPKL